MVCCVVSRWCGAVWPLPVGWPRAPPRRVAACLGVVEASCAQPLPVGWRERWEDNAGGNWVGPALVNRWGELLGGREPPKVKARQSILSGDCHPVATEVAGDRARGPAKQGNVLVTVGVARAGAPLPCGWSYRAKAAGGQPKGMSASWCTTSRSRYYTRSGIKQLHGWERGSRKKVSIPALSLSLS